MKLRVEPLTLCLRQPFRIAHGVSLTRENVLVRIGPGLGEAAAVPYLGETRERILDWLGRVDVSALSEDAALEDVLAALPDGSCAARAAVDIALHDAFGQRLGQPLYRLLGLNPERIPPSSFTIAIGTPEEMAAQAIAAPLPILKLKLGSDPDTAQDEARLDAVARASERPLRADANAGWSLPRARVMLPLLAERGVQLIEQPLPAGDLEGLRELSRLPRRPAIFADEGIRSTHDIVSHAGVVDGVVLKLAKCGGIRAALRDIAVARALGLEVLLSCMIESSVALTAAAHLAALCQHVDLDGALLIDGDPFEGVSYAGGRLALPERPGLGLLPRRGTGA